MLDLCDARPVRVLDRPHPRAAHPAAWQGIDAVEALRRIAHGVGAAGQDPHRIARFEIGRHPYRASPVQERVIAVTSRAGHDRGDGDVLPVPIVIDKLALMSLMSSMSLMSRED